MTRPARQYPTDIYAIRHLFNRAIDGFLSAALKLESAISVVVSVGTSTPGSISPKLLDVLREAIAEFRTLKFDGPGPECYFRLVGEHGTGTPEVIGDRHATFASAQMQARDVMESREYACVWIEAFAAGE